MYHVLISTDRDEWFLEVEKAEAKEQHKSIVGALKAAAPKWEFEQINFVVGNCDLVVGSDFYTKLKKLDVQEGKKDKLFADHMTQVCEARNRVIVSFLQQVQGGTRPTISGKKYANTIFPGENSEINCWQNFKLPLSRNCGRAKRKRPGRGGVLKS